MKRKKTRKNSLKRTLFILDPLTKLDLKLDTSLALLRELARRGVWTWAADVRDLWYEGRTVYARAKRLIPRRSGFGLDQGQTERLEVRKLDLVLIRKEPPFDMNYIYMTYLLDQIKHATPVQNDPQGIRNANEKLSTLHFEAWKPPTLVTYLPEKIRAFQNKLRSAVVLKPLDQKGGHGILLARYRSQAGRRAILRATRNGKNPVMVQRFLRSPHQADKRLLVLNGRILVAYEKRPARGDFRANLSVGGTCHPCKVTATDRHLVRSMRPHLIREGLGFVGLDVLRGKLIEMNVTCPAGIPEAERIYPDLKLVTPWADFLEKLAARRGRRAAS